MISFGFVAHRTRVDLRKLQIEVFSDGFFFFGGERLKGSGGKLGGFSRKKVRVLFPISFKHYPKFPAAFSPRTFANCLLTCAKVANITFKGS